MDEIILVKEPITLEGLKKIAEERGNANEILSQKLS